MSDKEDDLVRRLAEMMAEAQRQAFDEAERRRKPRFDSEQVEQAVIRLNRKYALVLISGKLRILHETRDMLGRPDQEFLTSEAFLIWEGKEKYFYGATRQMAISLIYLTHHNRRQYRGITFAPEGADSEVYNLWRGFAVEPSDTPLEKAAPIFCDHMRNNVAGGDDARLAYIWAWLSHMVQRPTERPGVALVLRGAEGSGKTKVGEVIGALLGPHYFLVDDPRYLVGQFNAFMSHCLLLQCDEGFWAGDKPSEGRLKGLITSSIQMIEYKGVDPIPMRNLVRLLITSNEGWVVPAGPQARRFAVFDVGEASRLNAEYFAGIDAEMAAGGREALLGFLLRFDLSAVDLRDIPSTSALSQQKIASMTPEAGWWFEVLRRGAPTRRMDSWDLEIVTDDFYGDFIGYCDRLGVRRRASPEHLRIQLGPLLPREFERKRVRRTVEVDKGGGVKEWSTRRVHVYLLPSLEECRGFFAERFGLPAEFWGSDEITDGSDETV